MNRYRWWRKLRGGYWVKFHFGWTRLPQDRFYYYWDERTRAGMSDTIENWEVADE